MELKLNNLWYYNPWLTIGFAGVLLRLQILLICRSWILIFIWRFWCFCTCFSCRTPLGVEPKHGQILGVQRSCKVGKGKKKRFSKTSKEGPWFCPTKVPFPFFLVFSFFSLHLTFPSLCPPCGTHASDENLFLFFLPQLCTTFELQGFGHNACTLPLPHHQHYLWSPRGKRRVGGMLPPCIDGVVVALPHIIDYNNSSTYYNIVREKKEGRGAPSSNFLCVCVCVFFFSFHCGIFGQWRQLQQRRKRKKMERRRWSRRRKEKNLGASNGKSQAPTTIVGNLNLFQTFAIQAQLVCLKGNSG